MPLFRSSIALQSFTRRGASLSVRQRLLTRPLSSTLAPRAQGYGDGEGGPKGESPQHQGSSNETKHNAEHPGPAPPSEGQGTGAGTTKGGSGKSPEDSSAQSGGARSKEAKETGSSPTGGDIGNSGGKSSSPGEKSKRDASPKIHDHAPGDKNSPEKQAEVEKHNREFDEGHDRAPKAPGGDKVDKQFWKGHGGADRQP